MSSRSNKWTIYDKGSTWSLAKGGRFLYEGLGSKQEVLRRLMVYYKSGETVILEEQDGYQTNITKQLRNSGIIR